MSARMDRSLVAAWGIGLALCGAGAGVTNAAMARSPGAEGAAPVAATGSASVAATDGAPVAGTDGAPVTVVPARASVVVPMTATSTLPRAVPSDVPRAVTHDVPRYAPREVRRDVPVVDSALVLSLRDTLRRVLETALADSAFPGAYAVVGSRRGVIADYAAGRTDWAADAPPPSATTIWDMASLTKVVAVTTAVARLVDAGMVSLDAPVQRYLPAFAGPGKERVTVRHLLTHSSGLPSWRPLHKEAETPEARRALVLATPLDTLPGVRYAYSDLGAITLGLMVERLTKQPLDRYLARRVFGPLGMRDTRYNPDSALRPRIAPTEIDPWRQRHLHGEVHDENAFALGGVSGHAGLFSTGRDLARFARMYLNHGALGGTRMLSRRTVDRFTRVQDTTLSHRALGWETPNGSNSAGTLMGRHAFGHTGFTGTSIWMDPDRDLFVILLTNRVNPTRENRRIGAVRVALADAVVQTVAAHGGAAARVPASSSSIRRP